MSKKQLNRQDWVGLLQETRAALIWRTFRGNTQNFSRAYISLLLKSHDAGQRHSRMTGSVLYPVLDSRTAQKNVCVDTVTKACLDMLF